MIDLRSDTVTQPTPAMRRAMFEAPVGDDVFQEDPTINKLQDRMAALFGFDAALFCASGTMSNQLAIKTTCRSGDELICSSMAHVYLYEGGGTAANSGVSVKMAEGNRGRLTVADLDSNLNADDAHFPKTTLVCLEDTMNKGGGACYELEDIKAIRTWCNEHGISLHLDGARLFNALVAKGHDYKEYAANFDSISICLSKGLGCPVGSILLGSKTFIHQAHRYRKTFGGGMRQAGILAAAALYALDHHVDRMQEDHDRARALQGALEKKSFVKQVLDVETNIVVFHLVDGLNSDAVVKAFHSKGVKIVPFGPDKARMVTHLDFSEEDLNKVLNIIDAIEIP